MKKKEKYKAEDAASVRDAILDLVLQKKIDGVDLQIIAERDSKPFPSMREIALRIGVDVATVSRRIKRIQRVIINENKDLHLMRNQ